MADGAAASRSRMRVLHRWVRTVPLLVAVLVFAVVISVLSPSFLHAGNLRNVITVAAILAIPGAGMTLLIASGAFDLSVGAVVALTGAVTVSLVAQLGVGLGIIVGLAAAVAVGLVNGAFVMKVRISPLITTLATGTIVRGIVLVYTDGQDRFTTDTFFKSLSAGTIVGIPVPVVLMALVYAAAAYLLHVTRFGRHLIGVGSDIEAARTSGLSVDRIRIAAFAITAATAGLWGLITSSQLLKGSATLGTGFELDAITVAVVGGTPLAGGRASLSGTVLAAVLITVMRNGLNLLDVSDFYQQISVGLLLITALLLQAVVQRPDRAAVAGA